MNFKFFLTVALIFGCVVMLFMWYSANVLYKESQLYERQFLFKISTLESENKMELRLINALRIDISKNDEDLKIKSNLLESMHHKEKAREEEKEKLQQNIDSVKSRYEKLNIENNQWLDNWKLESQNKTESDKSKIQKLEDELEQLKAEYKSLKEVTTKILKNEKDPLVTLKEKDHKIVEGTAVKEALNKLNAKLSSAKIEGNLDGTNKMKSNYKSDDHQLQARPPIIGKDRLEKVDKSNNDPDLKDSKINIGPVDGSKTDNGDKKDDHQMQAKPPIMKHNKFIKVDEDGKEDQAFDHIGNAVNDNMHKANGDENPLLKSGHKDPDKDTDLGQLKRPKHGPINMNKEGVNLYDSREEIGNRNPKILKKDNDQQVKPPVPLKKLNKDDGNGIENEKKLFTNKEQTLKKIRKHRFD